MDFPDSKIEYNMENGYKVAELIKETRPNVIITWNKFERMGSGHPDHRNTASLVYDALNYARLTIFVKLQAINSKAFSQIFSA